MSSKRLGIAVFFETNDHKGHFTKWTNWNENVRPPDQNNEMDLPAAWWRGRDGINVTALRTSSRIAKSSYKKLSALFGDVRMADVDYRDERTVPLGQVAVCPANATFSGHPSGTGSPRR